VSSTTAEWRLPPLTFNAERKDRPQTWLDELEAKVTALPTALRARAGSASVTRLIARVNELEPEFQSLDDDALRASADEQRVRLRREGLTVDAVAPAFALVREAGRRRLGLRHHDVQLAGGYAMLNGTIAEMDTGEGKTLTATLTAATAALAGLPVHVVTVNDYLAKRDAELLLPLYAALGVTVGTIVHGLSPAERIAAYGCDVTYASNKEIAFDYLRDRITLGFRPNNTAMKLRRLRGAEQSRELVMRGLHFAIVDEADSVLVDEARTPLIISQETSAAAEQLWAETALGMVEKLELYRHYAILLSERRVELSRAGRERLEELGDELGGIWRSRIRREEAARQALTALHLFERGDHYLVQNGKVEIVDEYTGRIMADRSWSEGLHQLIEVKEGCPVTGRKAPVARITYQRFFRRYHRLAGMTGTAREVRGELWSVYRLAVTRIPPNVPRRTRELPPKVFPSADAKWRAIVERASALQRAGGAVLIGTRSVAASERLSALLTEGNIAHEVLNAAQDAREAEIIAEAGRSGRITVATNMAGRGVDIPIDAIVQEHDGLHVILSERHDARRIDRQLAGRCGRHGEPGVIEVYVSLEDPLLRLAPVWLRRSVASLPSSLAQRPALRLFRWCQRRAERAHSTARRALLKHDQQLGVLLAFSGGLE